MYDLEIVGAPLSNFVWTTRIAAEEKGVPYKLVPVGPHSPDVDAIHPWGKIPVLRHEGFNLCESRAITTYIDRAFPGRALVPDNARDAAMVEQWTSLLLTTIDKVVVRDYLLAYVFPGTPDGKPDRARVDAAVPAMQKAIGVLEAGMDNWVGGFTIADCYLLPIAFYARSMPESGEAMKNAPKLSAWLAAALERPSVKATIPPMPGQ